MGRVTSAIENAAVEKEMQYLCFDGRGRFYLDDVQVVPGRAHHDSPRSNACRLRDDFESCRPGTFPESWIPHANAESDPRHNCVTRDPEGSANQVLQVFGSHPHNWSALVFRRCALGSAFAVTFRVYVEQEFLGSPGGFSCQIRQAPDWQAPGRSLVAFTKEGQATLDGQAGVPYRYGRWYSVRTTYERAGDRVTLSAWLDGQSVGRLDATVENTATEDGMQYLCFDGRGRFYIDDVEIR
jgi:hypothetical protein